MSGSDLPYSNSQDKTVRVTYSPWLALIAIFFIAAGVIGGVLCFANDSPGAGVLLVGGATILAALLPLVRSTVIVFYPDGIEIEVSPWRHAKIKWTEITKAELKEVGSRSRGATTYLCLNVSGEARQRIGGSLFARFLNLVTSGRGKHDFWIAVSLLTMAPTKILEILTARLALARRLGELEATQGTER